MGEPPDGTTAETGADSKVIWREWGQAAFEEAARTDQPVLLSLVTPWSAECREMAATTYDDPRIAANINDGFVPVRVDADRNPQVRERYNMGGFPSTVFLTPRGEILTGATFLGVDGFRGILDSVRETWTDRGEAAGSVPRSVQEAVPPGGELDHRIEEHMVEQLLPAYDEEFGGWGTDVKFPMARTVEFALLRARDQATRTLEALQTHLLDTYDGGFYRFARNRNWRGARREKLTDENAALLRAFAYAYRYTGEQSYRRTAEQTVEFLTTTLWTDEGFAGSQGGDEAYFRLAPTDRETADPAHVDETVFADRNGLAVDALLSFAAYTDDETAVQYARRAREAVVSNLVTNGRVTHYRTADTAEDTVPSGLLLDQARVLTGLTTSWQVLGEPGPALSVADWTLQNLQAEHGGFYDGPVGGPGLLDTPLYPLDATVECADALLNLALLTGSDRYRTAAGAALAAYAGAADRMGVEVAQYATVAARLDAPTVLAVGTPAGTDLHRAALRLADHEAVVVPSAHQPVAPRLGAGDSGPDETVADCHADGTVATSPTPEKESLVDAGTARLRVDGSVVGTADSPAALEKLLVG